MKIMTYILAITVFTVLSCRQSESPTVSDVIDSTEQGKKPIIDTKGPDSLAYMDTTEMVVDSLVHITIDGTSIKQRDNAVYQALYNNWLRAYTESKHLPAFLHVAYEGTVMMVARGNIIDEITKAQDNMKQYIARANYKKKYDLLSSAQLTEMQKEHTILFQKDFR